LDELDHRPNDVELKRGEGHSGYHEWMTGDNWSCSSHKGCHSTEPESINQALAAVSQGDYLALSTLIDDSKGAIRINSDRHLLQFRNCRGAVFGQVAIDAAAFEAAVGRVEFGRGVARQR
jgi:hypothetical protein